MVNGHVESTYSKATGKWTRLRFVSDPYVRIHGMSPALNYGQQALEGLKAFRQPGHPGSIAIFRPDRNAMRLQHSARVLSMPPVPSDLFIQACRSAVALNGMYAPPHASGGALYIRPQLYGSSPQLGLQAPEDYTFCVFVIPTGRYLGARAVRALIVDDFDRAAPRGTGHAKVGGNYAPVLRWSDQARSEGFGLTLHLDSLRHEEVDEFSTCGFIGVLSSTEPNDLGRTDPITLVVPDSPCVINSVISDSVQCIARSLGWRVEKRRIPYTELPAFSEVFGAGTAVSMTPVRSITRRRGLAASDLGAVSQGHRHARVQMHDGSETITFLSDDQPNGGPVYARILDHLQGIQRGTLEDDWGWRFDVRSSDLELDLLETYE